MIRLAFKNPYLVVVVAILVAVMSVVATMRLPIDILPQFKIPAVQVLTIYNGMQASVLDRNITSRLERWTGQADGITQQQSKSMNGASIVKNFFTSETPPAAALTQVSALAFSAMRNLPPGTLPPLITQFDPTASVPLALLAVSSDSLSEKEIYDLANFEIRTLLGAVEGITVPTVFGGQIRRVFVYVDPDKLQARKLSQLDIVEALSNSNVMIPTGNAQIGGVNYNVNANALVQNVKDFDNVIIKFDDNGAPIYVRDIGRTLDANAVQTNIVHVNGKSQVYIPIYKRPGANTIRAIDNVQASLKRISERLQGAARMDVIMDQSAFVRSAIEGLSREAIIGLVLVCVMLLIFLGGLRPAFIVALSLPLSAMFAFIGLLIAGESINTMTLGGLALAIGLLVDNSIVVLENIDKHLKLHKTPMQAAFDGASEVALPVTVTTLVLIIVFLPILFLTGVAKFLFTPLAIAVSLSMIGSIVFSLTLIPVAAAQFLKPHEGEASAVGRFLERLENQYQALLITVLRFRWYVLGAAVGLFALALVLATQLGTELFPASDAEQFTVYVRMEPGYTVERSERIVSKVEEAVRRELGNDAGTIVSNIGILYGLPAAYTPNSGTFDAFVNVQLQHERKESTFEYVRRLRMSLPKEFGGVEFAFDAGGIITAALNLGAIAPIDVQITGKNADKLHAIARQARDIVRGVDGAVDVRVQQRKNQPELFVEVDREKAAELGLTQDEVIKNLLTAVSSSVNFNRNIWTDERTGNFYYVGVMYPEGKVDAQNAIENIAINNKKRTVSTLLKNIATVSVSASPPEINHADLQQVVNIYASAEGRDVGSVSAEIETKLEELQRSLPAGYALRVSGEYQSLKEAFGGLSFGLVLAVIMVYLVIVPLLRSFKLPLIILLTVPLGLTGVVFALFVTNTTLNIQSFLGVIMMVGITVAYTNLLVDRINTLRTEERLPLTDAITIGASSRLRPVLMTAITAVMSLLPMALGLERGGEANVPLGRAIIGGTLAAAFLTMFVAPCLFFVFASKEEQSAIGDGGDAHPHNHASMLSSGDISHNPYSSETDA